MSYLSSFICSFFFHSLFKLLWVFVAMHAFLQLQAAGATLGCGAWASHCSGFSGCRAQALGTRSGGSRAPEQRLSQCGTRAQLLLIAWNLLRPGIEPMSATLTGRFLSTVPPVKSYLFTFLKRVCFMWTQENSIYKLGYLFFFLNLSKFLVNFPNFSV